MKSSRLFCIAIWVIILGFGYPIPLPAAETCEDTVRALNRSLNPRIDEKELILILKTLSDTGNKTLPPKFVTKNRARQLGWRPGDDLWSSEGLRGKSIGGDVFGNREGRLPSGKKVLHEADLDYRGGRRGAKRIVYSSDGFRWITVDHYKTFREVPPCR